MAIRDPLDTVQYKLILIPKFNKDKGLVIIKTHHAFGDGLAVSTLLLYLSKYESSALPGLKPMGYMQSLYIELCMFYRVPIAIWTFLVTYFYVPVNAIRQRNKLSGIKKVGVSAEFKLDSFK
jgi:hypothetical protein